MDPLDALATLTVPTLANAVEVFEVVPPNTGYNTQPLTCHFPSLGICVGYAATVTATSGVPTGNVEFFDSTSGADLGAGTLASSGAGAASWVYTTAPRQLQATGASGDIIRAEAVTHHAGDAPELLMDDAITTLFNGIPEEDRAMLGRITPEMSGGAPGALQW